MSKKLQLIVTCTNRKRVEPEQELRLRNLASSFDTQDRAREWIERVERTVSCAIPAGTLYIGEHWHVAKMLPEAATKAGFEPELWVLSAGYGLIHVRDHVKPYAATFSTRSPDAVSSVVREFGVWWNELCQWDGPTVDRPRSISELAGQNPNAAILVVGSPPYLRAVYQDLRCAIDQLRSPDRVVVVSAGLNRYQELDRHLMPGDARFQNELGGARQALNARIALKVLEQTEYRHFNIHHVSTLLAKSLRSQSPLVKYDRTPMTDDEVKTYVEAELRRDSSLRKTPLLRRLRETGHACEQKRFGLLYFSVKETLR